MLGTERVRSFLAYHCGSACDVALLDTAQGLWDAPTGMDLQFTNAQQAKDLGARTVLVTDQCASVNGVVALLRGYIGFDPALSICGVVCNKAEPGITKELLQAAADAAGLNTTILGCLPKVCLRMQASVHACGSVHVVLALPTWLLVLLFA